MAVGRPGGSGVFWGFWVAVLGRYPEPSDRVSGLGGDESVARGLSSLNARGGCGDVPEVSDAVGVGVRWLDLAVTLTKASNRSQLWSWVYGLREDDGPHLGPVTHPIGVGHALDLVAESLECVAAVNRMEVMVVLQVKQLGRLRVRDGEHDVSQSSGEGSEVSVGGVVVKGLASGKLETSGLEEADEVTPIRKSVRKMITKFLLAALLHRRSNQNVGVIEEIKSCWSLNR
ncbi:hypothetical protein CYMTET_5511 [Cymbomonas tetramitiformis]|uniref:Uncharacterized protein n=1 Tax=Cymbomonas tetramitiformis TaxID=36881 RepID=A0AAE0LJE1_9CHLO|nr:hypothetical protein CYMTET_5511 [Cymbomonas tetramitiformis]